MQDEWKRKRLQRKILQHRRPRQGKPKSSSQSSQAARLAVRKTLADHIYAVRSAKQVSDHSVITAFIVMDQWVQAEEPTETGAHKH